MHEPQPVGELRAKNWSPVPATPGVYWWYFPQAELDRFAGGAVCDAGRLRLRQTGDGYVCLYHGIANNLRERVKWHAAQKLALSGLKSGFISTLRLTLLALNEIEYRSGDAPINAYFDSLRFAWQSTASREEALAHEAAELAGEYHYLLNIQGNRRAEVLPFVAHLKRTRRDYKRRHLLAGCPAPAAIQ